MFIGLLVWFAMGFAMIVLLVIHELRAGEG
jgi:hypothetical protein